MQREEIAACLKAATGILEKIRANTETQGRLIPKRQMTGLRRLLREREALISELAAINDRLQAVRGKMAIAEAQALAELEREVLAACGRVLRQALAEQTRTAAELKRSRVVRQAQNRYLDGWRMNTTSGHRLNIKG